MIDVSKAEVRFNGEWFGRFSFLDTLALTSQMTLQRMLERDDFTKRYQKGTPIYLHECLYPLMQGRDSVEIRADVELGGSEQLFSLMVGRDLQRDAGQEPQVCITLPILRGRDGHRRMGKSLDNYVGVGESANEMFAKVMSIPDELMREWFELLTERTEAEINRLTDSGASHPMKAKQTLGTDIVAFYYGPKSAAEALAEWDRRFSQRKDPSQPDEISIRATDLADGRMWICQLLVRAGLAKGNNEARRLLGPNSGVTIGPDREKVTDATAKVSVYDGLIVRVGSKRIVRIRVV